MVVENLIELPPYAQYVYEQELRQKIATTFGAMVGYWQKELDSLFEITVAESGFCRAIFEMLKEDYGDKIKSADTPEKVTRLYEHYDKSIRLTECVIKAGENYLKKLTENINTLVESAGRKCPCCGGIIPIEYLDELRMTYDKVSEQLDFYKLFLAERRAETLRLNAKVDAENIKVDKWQFDEGIWAGGATA